MLIRSRVLVLNQNYQPLNICDVRRAVSLLGKGKAETVQHGVEYIHTVSRMFERPEVIRLVYMVRKPLHRRKLSRREVFQRDGYVCQYCGKRSTQLTLDHVIPRCKGGQHTWENVVTACQRCNHRKAGVNSARGGHVVEGSTSRAASESVCGFPALTEWTLRGCHSCLGWRSSRCRRRRASFRLIRQFCHAVDELVDSAPVHVARHRAP